MRQKILMLAAVFFGVLAFIFTYQQIKQERSKIMNSAVRVRLIRMKADVSEGDKLMDSDIEMYEAMRFANAAANTLEIPWDRRSDVIGSPLRSMVNNLSEISPGPYIQFLFLPPYHKPLIPYYNHPSPEAASSNQTTALLFLILYQHQMGFLLCEEQMQ